MIAKEGLPRLQWPIAPRHHADRNRGLGDLDAELEQFTVNLCMARFAVEDEGWSSVQKEPTTRT
jgi:hypothetical protein